MNHGLRCLHLKKTEWEPVTMNRNGLPVKFRIKRCKTCTKSWMMTEEEYEAL